MHFTKFCTRKKIFMQINTDNLYIALHLVVKCISKSFRLSHFVWYSISFYQQQIPIVVKQYLRADVLFVAFTLCACLTKYNILFWLVSFDIMYIHNVFYAEAKDEFGGTLFLNSTRNDIFR